MKLGALISLTARSRYRAGVCCGPNLDGSIKNKLQGTGPGTSPGSVPSIWPDPSGRFNELRRRRGQSSLKGSKSGRARSDPVLDMAEGLFGRLAIQVVVFDAYSEGGMRAISSRRDSHSSS